MVFFGGGAQSVEHDSGLYAGDAAGGIDFENPRHVLGKIEHDGDVAALAGKRRAAAAAQQRRAELAAERDRGENIVGIAGKHYADGNLAVVGAVGGVERAGAAIETDFAIESLRAGPRPACASTDADLVGASSTNRCGMGRGEFWSVARVYRRAAGTAALRKD